MAKTSKTPQILSLIGVALLLFTSGAFAQKVTVAGTKIIVGTPKTPRFSVQGTDSKRDDQKTWVEVEVEFKADQQGKEDFIDALEFRYYITIKPKEGDRQVFTLTLNHINIPKGETVYSVAYISPTTIAKIIGKDATVSKSNIDVAVEIRSSGSVVGGDATKSPKTSWWTKMPQQDGMVLNKTQTPFAPLWWDRYAEVQGK
ncbi:MAG: hypothetical protein ACI8XO_003667 [Verrucomicrobiales bacterium]|jgi:hypothetical protein